MKKLSILLSGVLALAAFTACDDAPEAAKPQKNPQPALFTNADVTAQLAAPLADASAPGAQPLNLQDYREENLITVMDNISYTNVPAGSEVVFELQISNQADFPAEGTRSLEASADEQGKATVLTSDWNAFHYELAGKSMTPKTFYYRVYGYVSLGNTRYMIADANPANPSEMVAKVFAQGQYEEIPFELVIDSAYYFVSNATTWDAAEAVSYKFDHEGDDVYENPVFTYKFEVTQDVLDANGGGCYWKVASQTTIDNNDINGSAYGPSINGDKSLSGKLTAGGGAGQVNETGQYTITINMEEMTYQIVKKTRPEYIVVASQANGWSDQGCSNLYWSNKEEANKQYFCGAAVVDNIYGFKFIWDGTWYGENFSTAPDAGNIQAPADGTHLYWFTVDTEKLTYTIKEVTSLGLIGVTGWDAQKDVIEMTPSEDCKTWTIENVTLSDGFKVIINNDWGSNYGFNDAGELAFDAGNISGHAGAADVTLSFAGPKPVLTITAK